MSAVDVLRKLKQLEVTSARLSPEPPSKFLRTLPPDLPEPYYYLSVQQREICNRYDELKHVVIHLPGWVPHRWLADASIFGHSHDGINKALKTKTCDGHPYVWATEFENCHSVWNFDEVAFEVDHQDYEGSEDYFQKQKPDPFDADIWDSRKDDVMRKALLMKFTNPTLQQLLLATYPHPLLFNTYDRYWGVEPNGDGENKLGCLLMELRQQFMGVAPAPAEDWFSDLFGFEETSYWQVQRWLRVKHVQMHPSGTFATTLHSLVNGSTYSTGTFDNPCLSDLRQRGEGCSMLGRLVVTNEVGDISDLHAKQDNRFATFQVASQFNCLEMPGPNVVPDQGVTGYVHDKTQGPACCVTCGPATVFRNYFVPLSVESDGADLLQIGQTSSRQIDNLIDVHKLIGNEPIGHLMSVVNGYSMCSDEMHLAVINSTLAELRQRGQLDNVRDSVRIGVHQDVLVTSCDWGRVKCSDSEHVVTQVFSSACAVGYNKTTESRQWEPLASLILEATYEATLWAAVLAATRRANVAGARRVYLTTVGGGVFRNPIEWVVRAMRRAFERFRHFDLDVRIVARKSQEIDPLLVELARDFSHKTSLISPAGELRGHATDIVLPGTAAQREQVLTQFQRYDENLDTLIDRAELENLLRNLGGAATWTHRRLDRLFSMIDCRGDGRIDYEEFLAWVFGSDGDKDHNQLRTAIIRRPLSAPPLRVSERPTDEPKARRAASTEAVQITSASVARPKLAT